MNDLGKDLSSSLMVVIFSLGTQLGIRQWINNLRLEIRKCSKPPLAHADF